MKIVQIGKAVCIWIAAVGAGSGFDSDQMENLSEAIALSHYLNRLLQGILAHI